MRGFNGGNFSGVGGGDEELLVVLHDALDEFKESVSDFNLIQFLLLGNEVEIKGVIGILKYLVSNLLRAGEECGCSL